MSKTTTQQIARKAWVAPALQKLRAGEAEGNIAGNRTDGIGSRS